MSIELSSIRVTVERYLAECLNARALRCVGSHEYQVTSGEVRVQIRPERRLYAVVSFRANRSSRALTVREIEADYDAALTAAVIRFLLEIGIGVDFSVTTVAFSRAVSTENPLPVLPATSVGETHPWR